MHIEPQKIKEQVLAELKKRGVCETNNCYTVDTPTKIETAKALEHSMLGNGVTEAEIRIACGQLIQYGVGHIVVPQWYVKLASTCCTGSDLKVVTTVSFPNGGQSRLCKLQETQDALANGADEIDYVPNFDMILRGKFHEMQEELSAVIAIAKPKMKVKVNIEWCMFTDEIKVDILKMAVQAGADFVKVQHYLAGGKALVEEVKFIRDVIGNQIGVKIDGGIKTAAFARELIAAGANRLGLTATLVLVDQL